MNSGIFHTTYVKDMALRRTHAQKIRIVHSDPFRARLPLPGQTATT